MGIKNSTYQTVRILRRQDTSCNSTENSEIIHLIWIGETLTSPALMFLKGVSKIKNFRCRIIFWIDFDIFKDDIDEIRKYHTSFVNVDVKDIHSLEGFQMISENIYPLFLREKAYNYLKEIISLMALSEYSGYYFDTTTVLVDRRYKPKNYISLPKYPSFVVPWTSLNTIDVFMYYCPLDSRSLVKIFLIFMINLCLIRFLSKVEEKSLVAMTLKEFTESVPPLINDKIMYTNMAHIFWTLYRYDPDSKYSHPLHVSVTTGHFGCIYRYLSHFYPKIYKNKVVGLKSKITGFGREYLLTRNIYAHKYFGSTGWNDLGNKIQVKDLSGD